MGRAKKWSAGISEEELRKILELEGIRHFTEDISRMTKEELKKHFGAKTTGRINLSRAIKNLIWQSFEGLKAGTVQPFKGNIRSFWYSPVKPVLSRADALLVKSDPYGVMIDQFVQLVMVRDLMRYRSFGFSDEGASDRIIGGRNSHIILIAEKRGHFPLLKEIAEDFDVTVLSLGGMPSVLSTEYFVDELKAAGISLSDDFPLLTYVDYDPSGDAIARSFVRQMKAFGAKGLLRTDLVRPQNMTEEQVELNKYQLSRRKTERKEIAAWVAQTGGIGGKAYGLEADAMPPAQVVEIFAREVAVYLKLGVAEVKRRREKKRLSRLLQRLILRKLGLG